MVSIRGKVALLVQIRDRFPSSAKLLAPHVVTRIWVHVYGPFEYPGEDPSVGCTFHPGVRSVSFIDPGLTLLSYKKLSSLKMSHLKVFFFCKQIFIPKLL